MNKTEIAVALLLVVMVAAVMYVQRPPDDAETLPPAQAPQSGTPAEREPQIRYPIEPPAPAPAPEPAPETDAAASAPDETPPAPEATAAPEPAPEPLPQLNDSDNALKSRLQSLFSAPSFGRMFYTDRLVRRLVVTIDNLPGKQYPRSNYRVARPAPGQLVVRRVRIYDGDAEKLYLNPDNYARYTPYIKIFTGLDSAALVAVYRHFYPLFQSAYAELGYPSAYFNDRLVDVIDLLLDTPVITEPIRLLRPHVLYQYADPDLEALSAGQKVLLRIGPENAARLKIKLREIRQLLTQPASTDSEAPAGGSSASTATDSQAVPDSSGANQSSTAPDAHDRD